jgi:hypothetical protein
VCVNSAVAVVAVVSVSFIVRWCVVVRRSIDDDDAAVSCTHNGTDDAGPCAADGALIDNDDEVTEAPLSDFTDVPSTWLVTGMPLNVVCALLRATTDGVTTATAGVAGLDSDAMSLVSVSS